MTPITIQSDRLTIEIAEPGTVYRRARFDWTAFITQVTLDGAHTFCSVDDPDPSKGSGGIGLCSEFGNEKPVGFDDAAPGQTFAKPGVGLLVRPSREGYLFFLEYEIAQPFPSSVEVGPNWASFTLEPLETRGYAFRQVKTVRAEANRLEITARLENVGTKPIHTHEYCHNFMSFDAHLTGPDYTLRFAYPVVFEDISPIFRRMLRPWLQPLLPTFLLRQVVRRVVDPRVLTAEGQVVTWNRTPYRAFYARLASFAPTDGPQWTLAHAPSGLTASETDDFPPARVVIWGAEHVISAEVYVDIDLQPGESMEWTRSYVFEKGG